MRLKNKHILIVGASSGIGTGMIDPFLNEGAKLTLTSRDKSKLDSDQISFNLDVANQESIDAFCKSVDQLDGLVYTPGMVRLFPTKFLNDKHIDEVRIPIFDGAVKLLAGLLKNKKIKESASVVFISSISSSFPYKGGAIYTSSKAALETYSKTFALENAEKGIRANCIKAGLVDTQILEETKENMPEGMYDKHIAEYPLGLGEPRDVAMAALFLLSDESKWITGTEITLDGGLTTGA